MQTSFAKRFMDATCFELCQDSVHENVEFVEDYKLYKRYVVTTDSNPKRISCFWKGWMWWWMLLIAHI